MNAPNESTSFAKSGLPVQARRAVSPLADDAARAREDALRSRVVALTGSPDGDRALAELYEGYEDEEKRRRALELYVKEDKAFEEIAAKLEVPERTVAAWAYVGKWTHAAMADVSVRLEDEAVQLARLRLSQRRSIIQKQLDSAQLVREKVEDELDGMSAKSAAEALKAVADIEARALGMSESGSTETEGPARKAEGKVPLVAVFMGNASGIPTLRKAPEGETVDV